MFYLALILESTHTCDRIANVIRLIYFVTKLGKGRQKVLKINEVTYIFKDVIIIHICSAIL